MNLHKSIPINQSPNKLTNYPTNQLLSQSPDQPLNQSLNLPFHLMDPSPSLPPNQPINYHFHCARKSLYITQEPEHLPMKHFTECKVLLVATE